MTDKNQLISTSLLDEVMKQISTQAALLAGFAFTGLTVVSCDASTPRRLSIAFAICSSLTIGLELLALFISGVLAFTVKMNSFEDPEVLFGTEMGSAWISYLSGLVTFLVALVLLVWMKARLAAIPITIIVSIAATFMAIALIRIAMKNNKNAL